MNRFMQRCAGILLHKTFFPFLGIVLLAISFLSSCTATKSSYYFKSLQKDTSLKVFVNKDIDLKIRKNDRLSIDVSSLNKDEDALYNSSASSGGSSSTLSSLATGVGASSTTSTVTPVTGPAAGYLVDTFGNIQIHKLGVVYVEGMTTKELSTKLEKDLLPYLKEPIISVNFANHHITILGDVGKPQILDMPSSPLSIFDALAMSGDVTLEASKKNILIIRDSLDHKIFKRIDLEDGSAFNTPWFYLEANDIVYVQPDIEKIENQAKRLSTQQAITIAASALSIIVIILDRVKL
jgi:polysaccharide biosynthesis/export protein